MSYFRKATSLRSKRGNKAVFEHQNNAVRYEILKNGVRGGKICLEECLRALFQQGLVLDAVSSLTCLIFVGQRPCTRKEAITHFFRTKITRDPKANSVILDFTECEYELPWFCLS